MKIGFEAHRRARPYCMGSLYWQLNDCWPVASWSGIDYYGRKKAMHYFIKKAFNEILVSPVIDNDSLKIFVVSDKFEKVNGLLSLKLMDFNAQILRKKKIDVEIPENSSQIYFSEPVKNFLSGIETKNVLLHTGLKNDITTLADNIFYFEQVKDLNLPDCDIRFEISREKEQYRIVVATDKLAKNIFLNVLGSEGQFSDNYFDLLPGHKKIIYFSGFENDFQLDENNIKIKTVRDTYLK